MTLNGKRDRAILAILLGCGLRRRELIELTTQHFQRREDHWAIVDLIGKRRARPDRTRAVVGQEDN
jgi:integrase